MRRTLGKNRNGFTLVEVLIVVVILGILAATVLPQFTSASNDAKESALRQDLQMLRAQIQMYKHQHDGALPGTTSTQVAQKLTLASKVDGTTAAVGTAGYPYGPYIVGQLPPNPFNGGRGIKVVTGTVSVVAVDALATDGGEKVGWIFSTDLGEIKANTTGLTADGKSLDAI